MSDSVISKMEHMHWLDGAGRIIHPAWAAIPHGFWGRLDLTTSLPQPLMRCRQVHGIKLIHAAAIAAANNPPGPVESLSPEADGVYSTEPGVSCAVQSADCLPILFHSLQTPFVAAVHAGWRGLTSGILAETVALYRRLGDPCHLMIGIGPAIGSARFEVGPDVLTALRQNSMGLTPEQLAAVIIKGKKDRWHIDLAAAAALQLTNLGIPAAQIFIMRSCTFEDHERWYSFRREGKGCGMNISWIG